MKNASPELLLKLYSAVGKPDAWHAVMADLCAYFDATIGVWVATGYVQFDHSFCAVHNFSEATRQAYSNQWGQHDVWFLAALKRNALRTGLVAVGTDFVSVSELHASAFYCEFLAPQPVEHLLVMVISDGADTPDAHPDITPVPPSHISFFRPLGAAPFTEDDKAALAALHAHLRRAYDMECQWRAMQEQLNVFHTSVNSMDFGVAFIDAASRVRHANTACDVLATKIWPSPGAEGFAAAFRHPASQPLQSLVNAAAAGRGGTAKLEGVGPTGTCRAVAIAMTVASPGSSLDGKVRAGVLLLIVDSAHRPDAASNFMSQAFALSKSESRVLPLLIKGLSPSEIALALSLKLPTVRSLLSSIFAKTGSARQQDLLALAGTMPHVASTDAAVV